MQYKVIFSIRGIVGGVDIFSRRLAEDLMERDVPCRILVRTHSWSEPFALPIEGKVPVDEFTIRKGDTWPMRWRKLIQYLEGHAPCIYLPNYDFDFSGIISKLSQNVATIGIVHSDDPWHYDHVIRLGTYFDWVVGVSHAIMDHVQTLPEPPKRLSEIHYGVPLPSSAPQRVYESGAPLRVVYSGRLLQHQKRIFDLPKIFSKLNDQNLPVKITILGDGPNRVELEKRCAPFISNGMVTFLGSLSNAKVLEVLQNHDAFLLTSDFEGMSVSLMEAMACGCIPVVTDIRSGVPELISDGENGLIVRIGDIAGFVNNLRLLQGDLNLRRRLSQSCYETIRENFTLGKMTDEYKNLFDRIMKEKLSGEYVRPTGPIIVPPWIHLKLKDRLPRPVRRALKIPQKIKKYFLE